MLLTPFIPKKKKKKKKDYADQYHPWFERKVRAFNKEGDSETVQKLKKDVEALEARLRKLEDAQPPRKE